MKKLTLILLLISSTAYPQAWKQLYSVPNKVTRFGIAVPKDVLIYEIDSSKIYRLTELRLPTDSMATAFRLNKYVTISGSQQAGSVDTTGWNIATKSDVPWYVASGAIKQRTSTDSVVPNYAITYANPIGYINARSATYPVTNYARMYLNGNAGSTSIYNGYNGPAEFANSSISYTQTPSAGAVTWLYGNSGYGTYKYQMDVNGLYPAIYSTAGTYNQYLGTPTGPWNYAYLKKLHISELIAGTASDSLLTTKDGEVKRIAAATFEPAITAGTTSQYWRGDKTWQTLPSSTPVDSIPFQRNASRGVTFLRTGTDKVHIGSTATPDSTLKVTGGVNVMGGLKVGMDANINGIKLGLGRSANANNTAIGASAITSNTTGTRLTAVGNGTLYNNTSGNDNVAVGEMSQVSGSVGSNNTSIGSNTLYNNSAGNSNTAVGYRSMNNARGNSNTAIGTASLQNGGYYYRNTAIGDSANYSANGTANQSSASNNTSIGYKALYATTTGYSNTAIGISSLYSNTTGHNNIAIGDSAGYSYTTLSNRTYLGARDSTTTGIYMDRTTGKNWARINGTLALKSAPQLAGTADSVLRPDWTRNGLLTMQKAGGGTTYTATSPMSVAGNDVHILADTLTSWRTKMGQGASAFTDVAKKQDSVNTPLLWASGDYGEPVVVDRVSNGNFQFYPTSGNIYTTGDFITELHGTSTDWNAKMTNPMTTNGDLIYQHPSSPTRIPIGTLGQRLQVTPDDGNGLTIGWSSPEWTTSGSNIYRSGGNVGVNTTNPSTAKLQIAGKKTVPFAVSTDNDGSLGDSTAIYVDAKGQVGIRTTAPEYPLDVVGNIRTNASLILGASQSILFNGSTASSIYSTSNRMDVTGYSGISLKTYNGSVYYEALYVAGNGASNGKIGIGTTSPTNILSLSGQAAQTIGMERNTTTNTAGNSLTFRASGATSGATDKLGGPLYYYGGISTGNATGIAHQWYTYDATTSGTTDQTATAKMTLYSSGILDVPKQKHSATDTTGMGSTANVGMMMYYNGHFYGLIAGTPPLWKQLDN